MAKQPTLRVDNAAVLRAIYTRATTTQVINVWGVSKPPAVSITQTLANTVGSAIKTAWTTNMASVSPTDMTLVSIGLKDINVPNAVEFFDSGGGVNGTGTGDDLPPGVAYVVTLRTAKSGPRYRGRTYLGPFTEANNAAGGSAAAAIQTACLAFIAGVKSALTTSGMDLGVLSRPAYASTITTTVTGAPIGDQTETKYTSSRPGEITPVITITGRNLVWDSQRRRAAPGSVSTLLRNPDVMEISF